MGHPGDALLILAFLRLQDIGFRYAPNIRPVRITEYGAVNPRVPDPLEQKLFIGRKIRIRKRYLNRHLFFPSRGKIGLNLLPMHLGVIVRKLRVDIGKLHRFHSVVELSVEIAGKHFPFEKALLVKAERKLLHVPHPRTRAVIPHRDEDGFVRMEFFRLTGQRKILTDPAENLIFSGFRQGTDIEIAGLVRRIHDTQKINLLILAQIRSLRCVDQPYPARSGVLGFSGVKGQDRQHLIPYSTRFVGFQPRFHLRAALFRNFLPDILLHLFRGFIRAAGQDCHHTKEGKEQKDAP